jgi:hypothetical protein
MKGIQDELPRMFGGNEQDMQSAAAHARALARANTHVCARAMCVYLEYLKFESATANLPHHCFELLLFFTEIPDV